MAVIVTYSNHFKKALLNKEIDIDTDSIKVLLMRSGFVFNKDSHATLDNIKKTAVIDASGNTITVSNTTNTFTRTSGSFLTDGFVVGNKVTTTNFTNANNNGTWLISVVTALVMTVTTTAGGDPTLTDETNTTVVNLTWASNDELATNYGYTQDTKTTGVVTLTEDDSVDKGVATYPTVTWTASGGDIGPTPGAILYDDTSSDNTIIHYIDFGAEETATDGTTFDIGSGSIKVG